MSGELQLPYTVAGKTVYAIIRDATGQPARIDTHVFEAYLTAHRSSYLVTLTEQGSASAFYSGDFPTWIPRGLYGVTYYVRKAGSPAENDTLAGAEARDWSGAALSFLPAVPTNFSALGITSGGHISQVDTLITYTGNTPQTGDVFAQLPAHFSAILLTAGGHVSHVDTLDTLTSAPANFSALGISGTGHVSNVDTLTTYTGNTPQSGNVFAQLPSNFAQLGITGIGHIATVDALIMNADKFGYTLVQAFPANFGLLAITTEGHIGQVDVLATYSGNTPQSGDVYAHLPANFSNLSITAGGHISNVDTLTTYTGNTPQTGDVFNALPGHFSALGITPGGHVVNVDMLGASALAAVNLPALGGVPGATPALLDAIGWIYVLARNTRVQTATQETVYADDNTTVIGRSSKADTGTVFSRGKYA